MKDKMGKMDKMGKKPIGKKEPVRGYKDGGMVSKGNCKKCGNKKCTCKAKGYMCGGKVKK